MVGFLETKKNFPFLHKLYMSGIIFLPNCYYSLQYSPFSSIDYYWENLLENYITKNVLMVMMVIFLVYAAKNWHHKLLRYLFWGNLLYLVFVISITLIVLDRTGLKLPGILDDSLVLYEMWFIDRTYILS